LIKEITYEAEAAITLEYCASSNIQTCYPYDIEESDVFTINVSRMLRAIMEDMRKKVDQGTIAARFHNTVIECALDVAAKLRTIYSIDDVCLSGGVFQNRYLYGRLVDRLEQARFKVHVHNTLPTNDGCISYGQVVAGNALASGIGSE
jgi:hydrogenase maturation protein HypF